MNTIVDISELLLKLGLSSSATDEERAIASMNLVEAAGAVRKYLKYDPVKLERTEYYPNQQTNAMAGSSVWEVDADSAVLRQTSQGASQLQLRHLPIRSITSLYIDYDGRAGAKTGAFAASTLKVEGTDYWPNYDMVDSLLAKVCNDGILMNTGSWPNSPGTIKVVYTAGYTAAELRGQDSVIDASPIFKAVLDEAIRAVRRDFAANRKHTRIGFAAGTITSESLGDYSYSIDAASAAQLVQGGDLTPASKERLSPFVNMSWSL